MDAISQLMLPVQFYCKFVFIVYLIAYSAVEARINTGPANTVGIVGSAVQLKCTINQRTCDGVIWSTVAYETGQSVVISNGPAMLETYSGRYHVNVSSVGECSLTINKLKFSDAGVFTCVVSLPESGSEKKHAVLSVINVGPQLSPKTTQNVLLEGDKVNISCSLTYVSKMEVAMYLIEDGEIIPSEHHQQNSSLNKWTVLTAERNKNFGPFKCRVTFTQNVQSAEFARNLVELQSDTLPGVGVLFPVGRSVSGATIPCNLEPAETTFAPGTSVKCHCDGFPEPKYKWIRQSDNATVVNDQVLSINESTPSTYQCIATNVVSGVTYVAFSPEVNFNGTEPIISASVIVPVVVSIVGVLLVILIIGFILWKNKKCKRSSSDAIESSKSSVPLVKTAKPLSNPEYERPAIKPVPPVESPPTPPAPLPSPTRVTAARRQPPNAPPSRTKTPDRPDVVPYSVPARSMSPAQSNRESDQIIYAEIEKPPQKPPRSTPTPQSDTVYASIVSA